MIATERSHLRAAIAIARRARENGNHPFGAVLVNADGDIVLEGENTVVTRQDVTGHAETNLVRSATARFDRDFLRACTLYSSAEPCPMCSGAIFWSQIGRVVFALGIDKLYGLTAGHAENPSLAVRCRDILERGVPAVPVIDPALEEEAAAVHERFWERKPPS